MFFLKIEFEVNHENNLFVIRNTEKSKAELAFNIKECDIGKAIYLLYYGFSNNAASSKNTEEKLCLYLLKKYNYLFYKLETNDAIYLTSTIRKYSEIYKDKLHAESRKLYFRSVKKILSGEGSIKVTFYLSPSLKQLEEKLKHHAFIKTSYTRKKDESEEIDLLITDRVDLLDREHKYHHTLFISSRADQIVIGPLIHNDKFELPILEEGVATKLLDSEIDLLSFFIERILFVIMTDLYDKAGTLPFLPNRYKLLLHRAELTIETEEHILIPKYLRADMEM